MTSGVQIEREPLDGSWVALRLTGEVDLANVDDLQSALDEVLTDKHSNLVVDLTGMSFMDSTGLKALIMTHREFEVSDRLFAIAVNGGPVSRLIDLAGLEASMTIVSDYREVAVS